MATWQIQQAKSKLSELIERSKREVAGEEIQGGQASITPEQRELYDLLHRELETMPPEQREVVILRHYADMSFKEIASLTRVSINTALGRMRYALINIRKMMAEREVVLQ